MPPSNEKKGDNFVLLLSVKISLYLLKNINLKPWFELCFNTVADRPFY
jgi:hypothetical protein